MLGAFCEENLDRRDRVGQINCLVLEGLFVVNNLGDLSIGKFYQVVNDGSAEILHVWSNWQ